jgi:WD40 repeat protein
MIKDELYILTCGEDTKIHISKWSNQLEYLDCLEEHNSSVRCLNIVENDHDSYLISAGGKEELIIWKIFKKNKFFVKLNLATSTKQSQFSEDKKNSKNIQYRILSLECKFIDQNNLLIVTGGSDSLVKFFCYSVDENSLNPVGFSSFHKGNVSQLYLDKNQLISAGTEGSIAIYELKSFEQFQEIIPVFHFKAHQSAITSLFSNGEFIASGGDDQSISLFDISKQTLKCFKNQHSTQITGIFINKEFLISTGIDQKLNIYSLKNEDLKRNTTPVDITNILNMNVYEDEEKLLIILIGCGMQIIQLTK